MGWNTPLASLGQLSWLCPLPAPAAPPACPLAVQSEKLESPGLSVSTALQQLKQQWVRNIILTLNPKHNSLRATRRKINSILAETRTVWNIPFGRFKSAALAMSLPKFLPTHRLLALGGFGERRCCASTSPQSAKHWCDTSAVLATSAEHSARCDAVGQVQSVPARPNTVSHP